METWERVFLGTFGALLLGVGLYALIIGEAPPAWRYPGGVSLCALGMNALYGGATGKRPWISRWGPLP